MNAIRNCDEIQLKWKNDTTGKGQHLWRVIEVTQLHIHHPTCYTKYLQKAQLSRQNIRVLDTPS